MDEMAEWFVDLWGNWLEGWIRYLADGDVGYTGGEG